MIEEKHRREVEAMNYLTSLLPGYFAPNAAQLQNLFDEYEDGTTQEAIIVKDVDKYELLVQALEYERDAVQRGDKLDGLKDLSTFFGVRKFIKTDMVKGWADDIMNQRDQLWKRSTESLTNGTTQ
jgi:putative hydrolases of HD superfamily